MQLTTRVGDKTHRLVWLSTGILSGGMIVTSLVLVHSVSDTAMQWRVGITAYLVFTASLTVGASLGFLFGLPRSRTVDQLAERQERKDASAGSTAPKSFYLANSNLIKVSDWLTTIIIGLGLVNLGKALPGLKRLGAALKQPLGNLPNSSAVGLSIAIGSTLVGFILAYLWTTIRMRELLEEAERDAQNLTLVPGVVGLKLDKAEKSLGMSSLVAQAPANTPAQAKVATQDPSAGTIALKGTVVQLTTT